MPCCLFLMFHWKTFLWTLFLDYLEPRGGGIQSLLWLIFLAKWHTLFPVIRVTMLHTLLNYFSRKLCIYIECHVPLCRIVTPSSWVTFGRLCGVNLGQGCCSPQHVIHKLMGKPKLWTARCQQCCELFLRRTWNYGKKACLMWNLHTTGGTLDH